MNDCEDVIEQMSDLVRGFDINVHYSSHAENHSYAIGLNSVAIGHNSVATAGISNTRMNDILRFDSREDLTDENEEDFYLGRIGELNEG